jgi:IS30 family transposase
MRQTSRFGLGTERRTIEEYLNKAMSFKQITSGQTRDKNTVAREVLRNSKTVQSGTIGSSFNNCLNRSTYNSYKLCQKDDCTRVDADSASGYALI